MSLANAIAEGKYTPLPESFSEALRNLIAALLHSDQKRRPSAESVAALAAAMHVKMASRSKDDAETKGKEAKSPFSTPKTPKSYGCDEKRERENERVILQPPKPEQPLSRRQRRLARRAKERRMKRIEKSADRPSTAAPRLQSKSHSCQLSPSKIKSPQKIKIPEKRVDEEVVEAYRQLAIDSNCRSPKLKRPPFMRGEKPARRKKSSPSHSRYNFITGTWKK